MNLVTFDSRPLRTIAYASAAIKMAIATGIVFTHHMVQAQSSTAIALVSFP